MREYGRILGNWSAVFMVPAQTFLRRTYVKMLWVFGSVAGLVAFSASLAAVDHNAAVYGVDVDSPAVTTQQLSADDVSMKQAGQQHKTVIIQTQQTNSNSLAPYTSLRVDNTPIAVPEQGTVHKDIRDDNGQASVDVTVNSTSTGDSSSSSTSSVILRSTTESTTNTTINTESGP